MSEPFLGEVRIFPLNYAPQGWMQCDGQILAIAQNQALFSLLGTTYGGNGQTTFALPNLNGRTPVHPGNWMQLGGQVGEENHTLQSAEMPLHTHVPLADGNDATQRTPVANTWAAQAKKPFGTAPDTPMNATAMAAAGGSQGHNNMQPYLVLNFCIATQGIYPSRN